MCVQICVYVYQCFAKFVSWSRAKISAFVKKPKSVGLFVFTSKCNMVEDHVSWQGLVTVKSVEVM